MKPNRASRFNRTMMWGVMALCLFTVALALIMTYVSLRYAESNSPDNSIHSADSIILIDHTRH